MSLQHVSTNGAVIGNALALALIIFIGPLGSGYIRPNAGKFSTTFPNTFGTNPTACDAFAMPPAAPPWLNILLPSFMYLFAKLCTSKGSVIPLSLAFLTP